jgi:formylglycine-generating enzyme required for sulfatase activity
MAFIPAGIFRMGSDHHYPEGSPAHRVEVSAIWISRTPVTNRDFRDADNHASGPRLAANEQLRSHGRGMPPARGQTTKNGVTRHLLIEMKGAEGRVEE